MKNQLIRFLKENVLEKILYTENITYALEGGKLEGVYSDQMIFSDLQTTENGIGFNMTTVAKEKIHSVDPNGKCTGLQKDFTGVSVFRYELAVRKSTNLITGFMRAVSSTVSDHTMEGIVYGVYNVTLENNVLKWKEKQLFYRDAPAGKNNFRPVAFDSEIRFYLENDKLIFEYLPTYFDVNPETMKKTPSGDIYPPYISREK